MGCRGRAQWTPRTNPIKLPFRLCHSDKTPWRWTFLESREACLIFHDVMLRIKNKSKQFVNTYTTWKNYQKTRTHGTAQRIHESPQILPLPFLYNTESQLLKIKQMDMLKISISRRQLWEKLWNKVYSDAMELCIGENIQNFHDYSNNDCCLFLRTTHMFQRFCFVCFFYKARLCKTNMAYPLETGLRKSINKMPNSQTFFEDTFFLISWLFPLQWKEHTRLWHLWWAQKS